MVGLRMASGLCHWRFRSSRFKSHRCLRIDRSDTETTFGLEMVNAHSHTLGSLTDIIHIYWCLSYISIVWRINYNVYLHLHLHKMHLTVTKHICSKNDNLIQLPDLTDINQQFEQAIQRDKETLGYALSCSAPLTNDQWFSFPSLLFINWALLFYVIHQ